MTLRWRLSISLVAVAVVGAIAFGVVARLSVERVLFDEVDRDLRREAVRLASDVDRRDGELPRGLEVERRPDRRDPPWRRGPGEFFGREALFAQVVDEDGEVLARTTGVDAIGGLPEPEVDEDDEGELELRTVRIDGERFRLAEVAGDDEVVVQVARPLSELSEFLETLLWVLVLAGGAAAGAALLLGPWAARATLRPVEQMTRTARRIARSPSDLANARVEPSFPDPELREFAESINEMLGAIDAAGVQQRRFVSDASHELRTPLTSLSGNATYLARTATLTPDAREALESVDRDIERLVRIADGLTVLARLDARPVLQLEPVDLDSLARESVERMRRVHPEHAFELESKVGTHVVDRELVRRILDNLLDNAGRYTPAGSRVTASWEADGDELRLVVADDGPGIDETEHDHVLQRFHRGASSSGSSGTGLGLAIVDEAAATLGGSLRLGRADAGGLRCSVVLRSGGPAAG